VAYWVMMPAAPNSWLYFWIVSLFVSLALFVGLSVWALARGYGDMIRMFRQLGKKSGETEER
jgi:hypothetical protein